MAKQTPIQPVTADFPVHNLKPVLSYHCTAPGFDGRLSPLPREIPVKTVVQSLVLLIVGYLVLTLINMGQVLALFGADGRLVSMLGAWVAGLLVFVVTGVTSFWLPALLRKTLPSAHRLAGWTVLAAVCAVMLINIRLDVSLEPLWYKVVYLVSLLPAFALGMARSFRGS